MKKNYLILLIVCLLSSCSIFKKGQIRKQIEFAESVHQNHIGFVLYDPSTKQFLYNHNGNRYFTPASNTKIFTFYAGLMLLKDRVPALLTKESGDSLIFWGTGDPSFLNRQLGVSSPVFSFLKNSEKQLYFSSQNYRSKHFGLGWAWDDYPYYYSTEKSPLPMYGNTVTVSKDAQSSNLKIDIPYFKRYFYLQDTIAKATTIQRHAEDNTIDYYPLPIGKQFESRWPFRYSAWLVTNLLTDTLDIKVGLVNTPLPKNPTLISGIPTDTLYRKMMQDSDNFIAEQLLLMCSSQVSDTLSTTGVIAHMKDQYLYDLPDDIAWVDGSGLSRYNKFTARTIVRLWEKIYHEVEEDRLLNLLAAGGQSGTLKNNYKADNPYIYGKTGTLTNHHNLSGFVKTDKGKTLIFAYMNNNHIASSKEVKKQMESLLHTIKQKY